MAVINDNFLQKAEDVLPRHLKGLKAFVEDYPSAKPVIVSLDPFHRYIGNIECLHVLSFFKQLWASEL